MLRRYWFKFKYEFNHSYPLGTQLGCGVTANDYEDALQIVRERLFGSKVLPELEEVIEDVDISQLDAEHVLPNMNPPFQRGIWFPRGYE